MRNRHDKLFDVEVRLIPRLGFSYDKQMCDRPLGCLRTIQIGWFTLFIWRKT